MQIQSEESSCTETESRLAEFERKCRKSSMRLTPQRLEIFRELAAACDHPSAYTLHGRLRGRMPMLSLDTVYRTLITFEQSGLITKVHTPESQARFDADMENHDHLICEICKEIQDIRCSASDSRTFPEKVMQWGLVKKKNVVFYGVCNKCLESEKGRAVI